MNYLKLCNFWSPERRKYFRALMCISLMLLISVLFQNCGKTPSGNSELSSSIKPVTAGLVAYFPFSGNANDASGNNNNGTMNQTVLTSDRLGNSNSAIDTATSAGGFIQVPSSDALNLKTFTLSTWFKMTSQDHAYNVLMGKGYATGYALGISGVGFICNPASYIMLGVGGGYLAFDQARVSCNIWYHVAVTYDDSTGAGQIYVNGALVQSAGLPAGSIKSNSTPFAIGRDLGAWDPFIGHIDEVRVYNRVLDTTEIQSIYGDRPILPPASVPISPSGLAATAVSQSQINLSWTNNSNNGDGFIISKSTSTSGSFTEFASVKSGVTTYSNTGLAPSTNYYYKVRGYNLKGTSEYSSIAIAKTLAVIVPVPVAPTNLTATSNSSSQITVNWVDNSNNETGFKIERGTAAAGPFTQIATVGTGVMSFPNSGLAASLTFYYRVRATNLTGDSGYSLVATAITQDTVPAAPNLAPATLSKTEIELSYLDRSVNETGFKIERSTSSTSGFAVIATLGAVPGSFTWATYRDTGLAYNTTYYYRMYAFNSAGNSVVSIGYDKTLRPVRFYASGSTTCTIPAGWAACFITVNWDTGDDRAQAVIKYPASYGGGYIGRSGVTGQQEVTALRGSNTITLYHYNAGRDLATLTITGQ